MARSPALHTSVRAGWSYNTSDEVKLRRSNGCTSWASSRSGEGTGQLRNSSLTICFWQTCVEAMRAHYDFCCFLTDTRSKGGTTMNHLDSSFQLLLRAPEVCGLGCVGGSHHFVIAPTSDFRQFLNRDGPLCLLLCFSIKTVLIVL
jgi:hypothetical protein